jgi:hypothetical protein
MTAKKEVSHVPAFGSDESARFEQDWARQFPDDPEEGRFLKEKFGNDGWLYRNLTTRAAYVMWQTARHSVETGSDNLDALIVDAQDYRFSDEAIGQRFRMLIHGISQ